MTARATLFDAKGADREIDLRSAEPPRIDGHRLLWIDVDGRDAADLSIAARATGLEGEAFDRLAREDRRARLLRLPDRILLTLGAVEPDDPDARRREIDIVIGVNHIITVHEGPLAVLADFRLEVEQEGQLGRLDAVSFTSALIDAILTGFFRQVEAIERDIDALDEMALRARPSTNFLETVLGLRRRIARLRRALASNRDALAPLERPDFELRADLGAVWPGLAQRLERAITGVENARDLLVGSFDLYLGQASQRTNDVMKVLTLVSSIALPGVVLAGVMGMNFKLPFFDDAANFWVVIGVMVAFSGVILGAARLRSWI